MPSIPTIAVIGAGIAGLAAARRLHEMPACRSSCSRRAAASAGGDAAHRRHGLRPWRAVLHRPRRGLFGLCRPMARGRNDRALDVKDGGGRSTRRCALCRDAGHDRAGTASAAGLIIVTGTTVSRIARSSVDGRWRIHDENGALGAAAIHAFDLVVLAVPSAQANPLIAASGVDLPGVERAVYAPCWALMVAAGGPVAGLADTIRRRMGRWAGSPGTAASLAARRCPRRSWRTRRLLGRATISSVRPRTCATCCCGACVPRPVHSRPSTPPPIAGVMRLSKRRPASPISGMPARDWRLRRLVHRRQGRGRVRQRP